MKFFATVLCLIWVISCSAQKKSRIVFFRMDASIGAKSSRLAEARLYTDKLLRDGAVIAKMRSNSVFIYNADSLQGVYFLSPAISNDIDANRVKLTEHEGAIVFIKISLGNKTPITSHSEVIDLAEFEQCYNHSKWLRNKLEDEGFVSVKDLINGFSVLPKDTLEKTEKLLPVTFKRNLTDTVFFGEYDIPTQRINAEYFSISKNDSNGLFLITDYYLSNGKIKRIGHFSTLDSESKIGLFRDYYKSGNLKDKGNYRDNLIDGNWEYYYDTFTSHLWYECTYNNGNIDGELKSYFIDGKLKREELHQYFSDTVFYKYHKEKRFYVHSRDSILRGRCFDSNNTQIKFTPFEKLPTPSFNLSRFLARILRYPDFAREHNIEGRVLIRFTINELGQLINPVIIKSVSEDIDREAMRAVCSMPLWNPAIQDDKFVSVFFTLPIVFKLE